MKKLLDPDRSRFGAGDSIFCGVILTFLSVLCFLCMIASAIGYQRLGPFESAMLWLWGYCGAALVGVSLVLAGALRKRSPVWISASLLLFLLHAVFNLFFWTR